MRALLALACGRGHRPVPPGDLRALRAKSLRVRRTPAIRMIPASMKRIAPWLALALVLALADQASKYAISSTLRFGEVREIAPFFNLVLAHNRGAAFSFLADAGGWQRALFIAIAVAATGAIVVLLARPSSARLFSAGLTLGLGGALGNLWGRIALGQVVGFLDLHVFCWPFLGFH